MAMLILSSNQNTAIGKAYLGTLPIAMAYLGNKLIFNGEQWLYCLVSSDSLYLETKDGFKLRPIMEA